MSNDKSPNGGILNKTREYLKSEKSKTPPVSSGGLPISLKGMTNILDALLAKNLITPDLFNAIKFEALNTKKSPEQLLIEKKLLTSSEIAKVYAETKGIPYVDLKEIVISLDTLNKIPVSVAKTSRAIAFEETTTAVKVAMKDPLDLQKIKYLEALVGKEIESFYSTDEDITYIIDTKYGAQISKEVDEALSEVGTATVSLNRSYEDMEISEQVESAPIVKIVNMILDYGIKNKASDIHIEPREKKIVVRFRIRGLLFEKLFLPKKLLGSVVTRIKILSSLKIDEHRIPQDGRFQVRISEKYVDLRVSVLPGIYGEKVVMRLLEKTQGVLSLESLGVRGISYSRLKEALKKTQGILLVTGPTGSGKTQTLASCLKILNTAEVNIMTLEDPVEIRIEGVNQVQVNSEVGLTFASGLRSFLRQDPDIIMVGEIRDSETAGLAVQSALVGRLVLSTVHTNSAAGAFVRLIDMGIEPFLLSSTVNLVIGQRLVRVLCECKQSYKASAEIVQELHSELDSLNGILVNSNGNKIEFNSATNDVTLFKSVGCPKCNDTGFISRTGIFEALKMTENIARMIIAKSTISDISQASIKEGMITMVQDGYIKALEGITTIEEVIRVKNE